MYSARKPLPCNRFRLWACVPRSHCQLALQRRWSLSPRVSLPRLLIILRDVVPSSPVRLHLIYRLTEFNYKYSRDLSLRCTRPRAAANVDMVPDAFVPPRGGLRWLDNPCGNTKCVGSVGGGARGSFSFGSAFVAPGYCRMVREAFPVADCCLGQQTGNCDFGGGCCPSDDFS